MWVKCFLGEITGCLILAICSMMIDNQMRQPARAISCDEANAVREVFMNPPPNGRRKVVYAVEMVCLLSATECRMEWNGGPADREGE